MPGGDRDDTVTARRGKRRTHRMGRRPVERPRTRRAADRCRRCPRSARSWEDAAGRYRWRSWKKSSMTFNSPERTISPSTNLPTARSALGDGHPPGDHVVQRAVREIPASGVLFGELGRRIGFLVRCRTGRVTRRPLPRSGEGFCAVCGTDGVDDRQITGLAGFARCSPRTRCSATARRPHRSGRRCRSEC